jgi:hypothetical protein
MTDDSWGFCGYRLMAISFFALPVLFLNRPEKGS